MTEPCPYASAPATLVATTAYCADATTSCIVDATCTRKRLATSLTATTGAFRNITNAGDLSNWPAATALQFEECPGLRIDQIKLPATLQSLYALSSYSGWQFAQCGWEFFPSNFVFPSALAHLDLAGCLLTSLHSLPGSIVNLYVRTAIEKLIKNRHLESNHVTTLENVRFDAENIYLGDLKLAQNTNGNFGNAITSLVNVTFSTQLRVFDCPHCDITTFVVDRVSYSALLAAKTSFKSVAFNAAACNAAQGHPEPLGDWTVCVTTTSSVKAAKHRGISVTTNCIVAVVASVVVLGMAIALFITWRRRRSSRQSSTVVFEVFDDGDLTPVTSMYEARETLDSCSCITPELETIRQFRLEASDVLLIAPMTQGSYGEVWQAQYNNSTIAVKKPIPSYLSSNNLRRMVAEIKLMAQLSSPHIVKFLGACWCRPIDLMMAMEYMDGGNLQGYLHQNAPHAVSWQFKLECICAIAHGLAYIHEIPVVHRDLKSRNILLDSKKGIKLGGFDVSRDEDAKSSNNGAHRWMAPEVLCATDYSTAADVFSFGMVLTEFDSHRAPYDREMDPNTGKMLAEVAIARRVSMGDLTPTFTSTCPAWLEAMAMRCIALEPAARPTAQALVAELGALMAMETIKEDEPEGRRIIAASGYAATMHSTVAAQTAALAKLQSQLAASIPTPTSSRLPHKFAVNRVTPRKTQDTRSTCWDFATISVLEYSYRQQGIAHGWLTPDAYVSLSEQAYGADLLQLCTTKDKSKCYLTATQNTTEGGWVEEFDLLRNDISIFPDALCPYVPTPGHDTECPGLTDAARAVNPLHATVNSMTEYFSITDIKAALVKRQRAMAFSTMLATIPHYQPCTGERTKDPRCEVTSPLCTACPPGYSTTCCLTVLSETDTNMDG
ncbi:hypothetical protein ACHHYP_05667, partial [Achlya hypogyna]